MCKYEIIEINTYDEVLSAIERFDRMFSPSITDRVSNLHEYASKLKDSAIVYVAMDTETIGFIAFYANNSEYSFVTLIAVMEQYRKSGVGQALVEKCFKISRNRRIGKVRLEVSKDNAQAIKFYENLGFNSVIGSDAELHFMEINV